MTMTKALLVSLFVSACDGDDRPGDPDGAVELDADVQVDAHQACLRYRGAVLVATRTCIGGDGPELDAARARWDALCDAATGTVPMGPVEICASPTAPLGVLLTDRACAPDNTVVWGPRAVTCLEQFGGP